MYFKNIYNLSVSILFVVVLTIRGEKDEGGVRGYRGNA